MQTDAPPPYYNARDNSSFLPPPGGPATRPVSFDEASLLATVVTLLATRVREPAQFFTLRDIIERATTMTGRSVDASVFARPVFKLMQRFVAIGAVVDVTPSDLLDTGLLGRRYRQGIEYTNEEWANQQPAADALGLPYVAHRFGAIAVRVHAPREDGDPGIGSGIVLSHGLIVTNRHVVEYARGAADVHISLGDSPEVVCDAFIMHPNKSIDLAVIAAPGFCTHPVPWIRAPLPGEDVVALAYPLVPQVYATRPQLVFTGTVATMQPVDTHWGQHVAIINAVMPPGASGGPVFGSDGRLVGLVVNMLEGQMLEQGYKVLSTLHAFIPGDMLLAELPALHPQFAFLNRFGGEDEVRAVIDAHPDQWWIRQAQA
jgi:S1-C subfamily serine protease